MSRSPLQPFPFQTEGVNFLVNGGSLLAFDMGLGKTVTSLWAALRLTQPGTRGILIGCPAVGVGVWEAEIDRVDPGATTFLLTAKTRPNFVPGREDYVIVSLDLAARNLDVRGALTGAKFTVLIIDEAHNLKDPAAIRTDAWLTGRHSIGASCGRVWLLSGTPTPNHAAELWPLITGTDIARISGQSYRAFAEEYCRHKMAKRPGGRGEVRVIAGTNMAKVPQLRVKLDGWWLRKKKTDVLPDLPEKLTRIVLISAAQLDVEGQEFLDSEEGRALRLAVELGSLRMSDPTEEQSMSRLRRLFAAAKAEAAAQHVAALADDPQCPGVVLWFWHRAGMDMAQAWLEAAGHQVCRIDGATPTQDRGPIVARFQSAGGPKIFIGQIKAAGVAITLTKANRAVFAEASWTPSDNAQAIDRIYRIGQTRGIVVEFLAARDSLDVGLMATVERKQTEINHLVEGKQV